MGKEFEDLTIGQAINQALYHALKRDPDVFLLGEDIADPAGGVMKITSGLSSEFGEDRVRDTPISEAAIMGAAAGASMAGMRPVAEIMVNDFLTIAMDNLVNVAAKHRFTTNGASSVPLTVRAPMASRFGSGATHSQSLEAWFMHTPGLKVAFPSTPHDAKGMLTTCIFDDDPCVFFENYSTYQIKGPVPKSSYSIPVGSADIKRRGNDLTLITYGWPVQTCLEAAEALSQRGIEVEIVDLRWLLPIDFPTVLASVMKTGRALIVHAATRFCGPGAEIAATIQEKLFGQLKAPIGRLGSPFVPAPATAALEAEYFMSADNVVDAVVSVINRA